MSENTQIADLEAQLAAQAAEITTLSTQRDVAREDLKVWLAQLDQQSAEIQSLREALTKIAATAAMSNSMKAWGRCTDIAEAALKSGWQ